MGKLVFYDIKADGEKVQAMAAADNSPLDEAGFVALHNRRAPHCALPVTGVRFCDADVRGLQSHCRLWLAVSSSQEERLNALAN